MGIVQPGQAMAADGNRGSSPGLAPGMGNRAETSASTLRLPGHECFVTGHAGPGGLAAPVLRALRRAVLGLFLERFPDGFVANEAFFVGRLLAGHEKARLAFRNLRSGCRLSTHKSPLIL